MKNTIRFLRLCAIAALMTFAFAACSMDTVVTPGQAAASISGTAVFTGGNNHAGITVTLEKTDGARSLGAVYAAEDISQGRSINAARTIIGGIQTGADGSFSFSGL